jgi:hypothetical protein
MTVRGPRDEEGLNKLIERLEEERVVCILVYSAGALRRLSRGTIYLTIHCTDTSAAIFLIAH